MQLMQVLNILVHIFGQVKYLGEEGETTPVAGAVSICSPCDLLVSCYTRDLLKNMHAYYVYICTTKYLQVMCQE
jgi:predicted alpha/beta-fold hydrolase